MQEILRASSGDFHDAIVRDGRRRTSGILPAALIRGGSCIVDPFGEVLCQPVFGEETISIAELDRRLIARAKFDLDVAGHYARPDVFRLTVNSGELTSVEFQSI